MSLRRKKWGWGLQWARVANLLTPVHTIIMIQRQCLPLLYWKEGGPGLMKQPLHISLCVQAVMDISCGCFHLWTVLLRQKGCWPLILALATVIWDGPIMWSSTVKIPEQLWLLFPLLLVLLYVFNQLNDCRLSKLVPDPSLLPSLIHKIWTTFKS